VGLKPTLSNYTPAIAGSQTRKAVLGHWRDQVIADPPLVLEESRCHYGAHQMAGLVRSRAAAAVAIEACDRVRTAGLQFATEDIRFTVHRPSLAGRRAKCVVSVADYPQAMNVEMSSGPAFAFGEITLPPGGGVRVEAGAMAMTRGDVAVATSTQGGFMKGLRRSIGGESFFVNDFSSRSGGLVAVAAALPGDMTVVTLDARGGLLVQSGSWIASDPSVQVDSKWGGGKSFFSGEGLILLRCTGQGDLLMSSYGAIRGYTLVPGETMTLDTGHVVAFDDIVQYQVRKAGSWKSTLLGGEGLVTDFTGPGRVWLQTRSSSDLIAWLTPRLPSQRS